MADDTALEARVRRLEDLEEIRQLHEDYIFHLDRGNFSEYAALFAKDGKMRLGPARADGRAEIERVARESFGGGGGGGGGGGAVREGGMGGFHIVSGPQITLDGDEATAQVMWTVIARGPDDKPTVTLVGHHVDDLVREEGHWRIQRRRGFIDIP
jgi:3-phenylpropionate/cinnamic acid dioxygenase small subunit